MFHEILNPSPDYSDDCSISNVNLDLSNKSTLCTDDKQHTPLHFASKEANTEIVESLLQSGVKMLPDKYGLTPLYIACLWERYELVEYFLRHMHSKGDLTQREKDISCLLMLRNIEPDKLRYSSCNYGHLKEVLALGVSTGEISAEVQHVTTSYGKARHHSFQVVYDNGDQVTPLLCEYLGRNNPAVLLSLNHDIEKNLRRIQDHTNALNDIIRQLDILDDYEPTLSDESPMTIHREIARLFYHLVVLPSDSKSRPHHIKELHRTTKKCIKTFMDLGFMQEHVVKNQKRNAERRYYLCFSSMEAILSLCLNLIVNIPKQDTSAWNRLQSVLQKTVDCCTKMSEGLYQVGVFHVLQSIPTWRSGMLEHTSAAVKTLVDMLIAAGADVNIKNRFGRTVLHTVAHKMACPGVNMNNGRVFLEMLIENGAHKDIFNEHGLTPVEWYRKIKKEYNQSHQVPDDVERLLKPDVLSLQCLSTLQINRHHIPHEKYLPRVLSKFVQMHAQV